MPSFLGLAAGMAGAIVLMLAGGAGAAAAESDPALLHVGRTVWGFDNTVQRRTFFPLSVEVKNLSPRPWTGRLRLLRSAGARTQVGAPLELEITLQGDEQRWVQFVPYLMDENETWVVEWGAESPQRLELPPVMRGPPPFVLIFSEDAVSSGTGVLRRMPEELFPTTVAATEGLGGVVLNSAPFWRGARAQTFLDWLAMGGQVVLLHNDQGVFPHFDSPLDFLNFEGEEVKFGSGRVRRLPVRATDLDLDQAREKVFRSEISDQIALQNSYRPGPYGTLSYSFLGAFDGGVDGLTFRQLRNAVAFSRRWWLIYLAVAGYLLMLFPYCYRIGHQDRRVRGFYGAFFATAALFSVLFGLLGQVGGAAQNRMRSVALVQPVRGDVSAVMQWCQLAAVKGGTYSIDNPGTGVVSSTCQETESVPGVLDASLAGRATFTMPPASTRTLLQRYKLTIPRPAPAVEQLIVEPMLIEQLSVSIAGCFDGSPFWAVAVYHGRVHHLRLSGSVLELDRTRPATSLDAFLAAPSQWKTTMWGATTPVEEEVPETDRELYEELTRPLLLRLYTGGDANSPVPRGIHADHVRLAVLVPLPAEMRRPGTPFVDEEGAALFIYDLPTN